MRQHLLGANIWKYKKGQGGEEMLKKVAHKQFVLVSTGGRDWLESNGEMNNELTAAQVQLKDMIRICNDYDFQPIDQNAQDILTRKVNVANACIQTVTKAMTIVGGPSFYQGFGLERLFRDIQGANFHPLPEKDQQLFSGEYILNEN